jgi:hypothetical protein
MALVRPKWCVDAHPTPNGWVSPNGELLKKQKITAEQIAEWNGVSAPAPKPQTLTEAPAVERQLTEEEVTHHYGEDHVEEEHHNDEEQ